MAHPNEELVRRGYDAFAKGDMHTLRELFDPQIVWHFPGRSPLAGDHRGVDAVLGFFGRTMELTAGTFRAEPHDVVADDLHSVGMHLATGEREGRRLEDRERGGGGPREVVRMAWHARGHRARGNPDLLLPTAVGSCLDWGHGGSSRPIATAAPSGSGR
jgi:uncharacterized protein